MEVANTTGAGAGAGAEDRTQNRLQHAPADSARLHARLRERREFTLKGSQASANIKAGLVVEASLRGHITSGVAAAVLLTSPVPALLECFG